MAISITKINGNINYKNQWQYQLQKSMAIAITKINGNSNYKNQWQ